MRGTMTEIDGSAIPTVGKTAKPKLKHWEPGDLVWGFDKPHRVGVPLPPWNVKTGILGLHATAAQVAQGIRNFLAWVEAMAPESAPEPELEPELACV